jgi:hypothetical protein
MLDRYFIGDKPNTEVLFRPDYTPNNVVIGDEVLNPEGGNLVVLFPPWHGGGKAYSRLVQRLVARDNAVLSLSFDDQLLTHDSDQVLESFTILSCLTAEKVQELTESEKHKRVSLIAASLGTPALAMTASLLKRFDSATLVTPGANLADCMWNGIRTQHVRRALEAKGETLESVNDKWQPIAPVNHVAAMIDKDVRIILSSTDQVIPARSQAEYAQALIDGGVQPKIETSRLGHYGTIGRFCVTGKL